MESYVKTLQSGEHPVELHRYNSRHWALRTFTMEYHFPRKKDALEYFEKYRGTEELWGS